MMNGTEVEEGDRKLKIFIKNEKTTTTITRIQRSRYAT